MKFEHVQNKTEFKCNNSKQNVHIQQWNRKQTTEVLVAYFLETDTCLVTRAYFGV